MRERVLGSYPWFDPTARTRRRYEGTRTANGLEGNFVPTRSPDYVRPRKGHKMVQDNDPFANGPDDANGVDDDPFSQATGGGSYLRPADLNGSLLMLTFVKSEPSQKPRATPGEMIERHSCDTVALDGPHAGEEWDEMFWSQGPIVKAMNKARRKARPGKPVILLGRLRRYPMSDDVKAGKYKAGDWQAIEAKLPKDAPSGFAWVLEQHTPEDHAIGMKYIRERNA